MAQWSSQDRWYLVIAYRHHSCVYHPSIYRRLGLSVIFFWGTGSEVDGDEILPVQKYEPVPVSQQASSTVSYHIEEEPMVVDTTSSAGVIHLEKSPDDPDLGTTQRSIHKAASTLVCKYVEHDDDEVSLGDEESYVVPIPMTVEAIG
jgi:hypothetical protein